MRVIAIALVAGIISVSAVAAWGEASHAGWPPIGHHHGHPNNESGTIKGFKGVHNELLGGGGNDTIWAGGEGDVIWGDSHPGTQPEGQRDYLHGGAGPDWIYASYGYNVIWTGAGNDHVALVYGHGTVYCDGPGLKILTVRYLPANRRFHLAGCQHVKLVLYRA